MQIVPQWTLRASARWNQYCFVQAVKSLVAQYDHLPIVCYVLQCVRYVTVSKQQQLLYADAMCCCKLCCTHQDQTSM